MEQKIYKIRRSIIKGNFQFALSIILISFMIESCSSSSQFTKNNSQNFDEVYNSPVDETVVAESKPETKPIVKATPTPQSNTTEEPVYKKYKEGEPEVIERDNKNYNSNSNSNNNSNNNSNYSTNDDYYYDDADDFTYGNSFNRLRYGDGYQDGYSDALNNNYYTGGGYYNSYYNDPYWSWNRPQRTQFWVGYNHWNGWNAGYSYSYPSWGWRTSYYPINNSFCNPWYGYPNAWGYYSNNYYGAPYGYYDPYFNNYYGGYYHNNYGGYNNYNNPWQRPVYVYNNNGGSASGNNNSNKGKMNGPRETIGSNTSSNNRRDQVSPRSRGGYVQQNPDNGGVVYDPKNDNRDGIVTNEKPKVIRENRGAATGTESSGNATTGSDSRGTTNENNGQVNPGNTYSGSTTGNENGEGRKTRIIDRTTTNYESNNPGRANENSTGDNSNTNARNNNGRNSGATKNQNRSYEPPANSGTTYEQPKNETRTRGRNNEPSQNNQRRNEGNSNPTPQRHEEPKSNPTPPSYNNGGGNRGNSSTPSGGSSGGSSNPAPRGRGR